MNLLNRKPPHASPLGCEREKGHHEVHRFKTPAFVPGMLTLLLLFIGLGLLLLRLPSAKFRKYVWDDLPSSVRVVKVHDSDWSFSVFPEFTCYMLFTASVDDVAALLSKRLAKPCGGDVPGAQGTQEIAGWWAPAYSNRSMRLFSLDRRPVGKWKDPQFIWVDGTGTNCYYLYWGI
jgi:hypothetical protein